jgi:hypothetical protein
MIVLIIGGGGYLILANYAIKKEVTDNQITINRMKFENDRLRKIITMKDNQIRSYQQHQQNVANLNKAKNIRNLNNARNVQNHNNTRNTKPQNTTQRNETQYSNEHKKKIATYNKMNTKKHVVDNKRYQRFSGNIRLVSDSRITIQSNNKLKSNASIKGRYYPMNALKMIYNIQCDNKKSLYNVRDECSMRISSSGDLVYLGKMESRNIANVDYTDHMIECTYSKKYGIMHDCKAKLKS